MDVGYSIKGDWVECSGVFNAEKDSDRHIIDEIEGKVFTDPDDGKDVTWTQMSFRKSKVDWFNVANKIGCTTIRFFGGDCISIGIPYETVKEIIYG